jgi:transposase
MTGPLEAEPKTEIRKFGTIVAELELLRDWLIGEGCSHTVMESTGSYWKPVFNILEDSVEVVLANAYMMCKTGAATKRTPMTAAGLHTCFATA